MAEFHIKNLPLRAGKAVYSYHAFLFPFAWAYTDRSTESFDRQTEIDTLTEWMGREEDWERSEPWTAPTALPHYNEVSYFYEFVRPVLYDTGGKESLQRHYQRKREETLEYVIGVSGRTKPYILQVDDIVVSFYETGVGVLALHCLNTISTQSSPADILKINYFGRRVYPPFFGTDLSLVGRQEFFTQTDWVKGLEITKDGAKEIADYLIIRKKDAAESDPLLVYETFSSWLVDQNPSRPPDFIRQLFPSQLWYRLRLRPILDDRMYVVSWYGNDRLVEILSSKPRSDTHYRNSDWWYSYTYVDSGSPMVSNRTFQNTTIEKATYNRWTGSGTFYGISRYSFVVLAKSTPDFFGSLFLTHTQTMYYKMALLALVQRASLMRFSEEITAISNLDRSKGKVALRISSLYQAYLKYINKVYFREVTAQEQGIELYTIIQEQMRLETQAIALQQEMGELHQYARIVEEDERNDKLDVLAYIGAFFVVPSFVGTYFGIGDYDLSNYWIWMSVFCVLSSGLAYMAIRSSGQRRTNWLIALTTLLLVILFLFPLSKSIWSS